MTLLLIVSPECHFYLLLGRNDILWILSLPVYGSVELSCKFRFPPKKGCLHHHTCLSVVCCCAGNLCTSLIGVHTHLQLWPSCGCAVFCHCNYFVCELIIVPLHRQWRSLIRSTLCGRRKWRTLEERGTSWQSLTIRYLCGSTSRFKIKIIYVSLPPSTYLLPLPYPSHSPPTHLSTLPSHSSPTHLPSTYPLPLISHSPSLHPTPSHSPPTHLPPPSPYFPSSLHALNTPWHKKDFVLSLAKGGEILDYLRKVSWPYLHIVLFKFV